MFFQRRLSLCLGLATVLALGWWGYLVSSAQAHERIEVGPYLIIVGWVEEPVIVGERNAILLEVHEGETPVLGLEASLEVSVLYAGRTFLGNLSPTGQPGVYTVEILPTVRGQYVVQLSGTMGDLEIDQQIEPEEVLSARVLEFPEAQPELTELQATIEALQSQLQTAYLLAIAGTGLGLVSLIAAGVALSRRAK